jgi:hypothetical protein
VYAGLLLFFISGPSRDDVDNLRTIVFIVLLGAMVAWALLLFMSARIVLGGTLEDVPEAGSRGLDEEEVLLEEYLGLDDEEAREEAEDLAEADDTEEGHA